MHTDNLEGRILDKRYQLRRLISRGGMASVYSALRLSIGDTVAVKVLVIDEHLDPTDLKRFQLEASASASIKHPNIIGIYDFGLLEDIAYIVMEYMEGPSLACEIARCKTISLKRAVRIFKQVASAVAAAHKQGVIHRDLKPSNIIFQKANGEEDLIKVVDFGIAKLIKERGEKLTSADFALGTPEYMSPEQCLGQKLDERSDIYALGIVLYETLTGQVPFASEIASAVLVKHAIEPPKPLSSVNPTVPREVEAVVMKALEKKPESRFHSASEFAAEFEIAVRNAEAAIKRDASTANERINERSGTVKLQRPLAIQFEEKPQLDPHQTEMVRAVTRLEVPLRFSFERFVGRKEELKRLRERFELSRKGSGQSLFITGDAGIGKTELVNQFQKSLKGEHFLYLVCKFYEYGNGSHYRPYLDSLHSFSRNFIDRAQWPDENASGITERVARELAEIDTLLNSEGESVQAQTEEVKYRTFETLSGIFQMLAERYPVILLLDDIHWADSLSLEFLFYLLRSSEHSKLFIVSTLRQQDLQDEKRPLRAWIRKINRYGSFHQLKLSALSRTEADALIHAIFGGLRANEKTLERLHQTSGGNPYYLCEIVRQLVQEGRIFWDAERWHCRGLEDIDLPSSILELVNRHLDRLSDDAVEVFTRAAVVGERFSLNLLQALTELSADALMDIIDTGLREYIIRESVSTDPLSDDCFVFYHSTLRKVLYERLSAYRRKRLHAQIAVKLESLNPRRVDRIAGELAYHYFNGENFEQALHYSIIAGDTFRKLFAIEDALRYYSLAEELLPRLPEHSQQAVTVDLLGRLHLAYGECLIHLGKTDLARHKLLSGLEVLDISSRNLKFRTLCSLAELEWGCGNYTEAIERCNQALLEREGSDNTDICRLYAVMGNAHFSQGEAERALECYREALVSARANSDVVAEARALRHIGLICGWRGEFQKALEHLEQALEIAQGAADLENERQILMLCGNIHYEQGEMLQAAEYYKKSLSIARKTGRRRGECRVNVNMGEICRRLGDIETARTYFEEALAIALEIQDREIEGHTLSNLGLLYHELGSLDLAIDHFQRALSIFKDTNYHSNVEAEALFGLASIFRSQERLDEARSHFRQALEASRKLRLWQLEIFSLRSLADCEAATGNKEAASCLLEEALTTIDNLLTSNPSPQEQRRLLEIQTETINQITRL